MRDVRKPLAAEPDERLVAGVPGVLPEVVESAALAVWVRPGVAAHRRGARDSLDRQALVQRLTRLKSTDWRRDWPLPPPMLPVIQFHIYLSW